MRPNWLRVRSNLVHLLTYNICTLPLTLETEFYRGDLTLISQSLFVLTLSQNEIYNDENIKSKNRVLTEVIIGASGTRRPEILCFQLGA